MRVLLATIGSLGDVQPAVSLALRLRDFGQDVRLCVPPAFIGWIEGLGFPVSPIDPRWHETAEATAAVHFTAIRTAASGCDLLVAASIVQIGARSAAEWMNIPCLVFALSPTVLPAPRTSLTAPKPGLVSTNAGNHELWAWDTAGFGALVNSHRASVGLAPIDPAAGRSRFLLAADPVLAPWPAPSDGSVWQHGAWLLPDERPLPAEVESFLDTGEPPVYFGFGSSPMPRGLHRAMLRSVRTLGRRAIVSGSAGLPRDDRQADCLAIGPVNQQALFPRVAAAVHHGGAGTVHTAALAGVPQVVIPQGHDHDYWAMRIDQLGIGSAHAPGAPTTYSLISALRQALASETAARALANATAMRADGARATADQLVRTNHDDGGIG
jgi:vancomycin aglycone glucosyltransferase